MAVQFDMAAFAGYLARIQGKLPATVEAYVRDVTAFDHYCHSVKSTLASGLTRARVGLYLVERTGDPSGPAAQTRLCSRSAARLISALKACAQFLVFQGVLAENPLSGFKPPKYQRPLPPYLNCDELRQLVCAFDGVPDSKPLLIRNSAILHVLYATGMRVSECRGLDLNALDHQAQLIQVTGKGRKQRVVPYGDLAAAALKRYLQVSRPALAGADSGTALWLNHRSGRLSTRAMRNILNDASVRAGQIKQVSPHKLRHACATHLLEGGADVRLIQELLGHESIATTQTYTQVTRTHLRSAYNQTHPRAGGGNGD